MLCNQFRPLVLLNHSKHIRNGHHLRNCLSSVTANLQRSFYTSSRTQLVDKKPLDAAPQSPLTRFIAEHSRLNDADYLAAIEKNAKRRRKGKTNLKKIQHLWTKLNSLISATDTADQTAEDTLLELQTELLRLPNSTCPESERLAEPTVVGEFGRKRTMEKPLMLEQLSHHGVDMNATGLFAGHRSYYLRGSMAQLESKLIRFALRRLQQEGFRLMSVPDLVTEEVLTSCGVQMDQKRTIVYRLDDAAAGVGSGDSKVCLSGTAEMALGGWLRGRHFTLAELPLKLCAVSRCYRAEADNSKQEQGIFRVHNFTKVEMFGVTANDTGRESDDLYRELVALQRRLLGDLGLHGQVVLMPPEELGNPAYSKTDIEVWLPGRGRYAELTSASNCTDYQAARLGATYTSGDGSTRLVHTVNGTAVAVPRCLIALVETHQEATGRRNIRLPRGLGLAPQTPLTGEAPSTEAEDSTAAGEEVMDGTLGKIMVYQEQCPRTVLPPKGYSELIVKQ